MAQKLSVQIALEGGAELKRQFAELGAEGTKAFTDIKKAAAGVGGFQNLDPTKVTKGLQDVGITGVASIQKIQAAVAQAGRLEGLVQGVKQLEDGFSALGKVITPLGGQFKQLQQAATATYRVLGPIGVAGGAAFLAVGTAISVATKLTIGFAQSITATSAAAIKLGVSFKSFDDLQRKMGRAGMSTEAITSGITKIQDNINKMDLARLQKAVETMQKLQAAGIRFAPGQGPDALKQLQDAATKIGPAGDFAREALRQLREETLRFGNVRFAPGIVPTLEQLKEDIDPVKAGMRELGITATTAGEQYTQIIEKLKGMTDIAERNRLALLLLGETAGTAFIQSQSSGNAAEDAANRLGAAINRLTAAWTNFGSVTFAPIITDGINLISVALETLQVKIENFSWMSLGGKFETVWQIITTAISAFTLQGMLSWIAQAVVAWTGLGNLVKRIIEGMKSAGPTPSRSDTGDVSGMAGGGLLGGRGTGTSDSNLAWLSRGEYVTPAHAVAQPGVLAFLEALRRSGGNLSRVLNGMGHFALGGMVPRAIPAYAAGGINSGSNVTIQFPGMPAISGLRASSNVVDQLQKAAALAQVRSGGRKPSRYS